LAVAFVKGRVAGLGLRAPEVGWQVVLRHESWRVGGRGGWWRELEHMPLLAGGQRLAALLSKEAGGLRSAVAVAKVEVVELDQRAAVVGRRVGR
jgi:hypothetical protein